MTAAAETSLRIGGMHCAACADTVEQALRRVPGVLEAHVSAAAQVASIRWDAERSRIAAILEAVRAAGYEATPDTAAAARQTRVVEARAALWRLFVAGLCAVQVMMLAEPAYLAAPGDIAPEYLRLMNWGAWLLTLPVLAFSAAPFFRGAWRALRGRRIGMDVPVSLGIAVAFVASTAATWDPGGPFGRDVYFDSITMFVAFLLGARYLEMKARHHSERELEGATSRLPHHVLRVGPGGIDETISIDDIRPGDLLRVPRGEAFSADGTLVDGATETDESLLTGESRPRLRQAGDDVVAGSLNLGAPVLMHAERVGADTRYEAIAALMRAARTQKPAVVGAADRWAGPFLWTVLALAALAAVGWSFADPQRVVWVVVSVLIVTCPCALSLAAPAALLAAANRMAREGLLLRDVDALARLVEVDTLFVDKTGTLTSGRLRCTAVEAVASELSVDALAARASSLAAWSTHPLSRALQAARDGDGSVWHEVREAPGHGIEALDAEGRRWRLGSTAWAGAAADVPADATQALLSCAGRPMGLFSFGEDVRQDAAAAIAALQADGVTVHLLSGDTPARVAAFAGRLGLDSARGGLSPEGKLAHLRGAQQSRHVVAMVGDGINDAPVLAQADVSIAMGEGAQVARTQADGVLLSNRLSDIAKARALARRTLRVIRQNLAWAAGYNLLCIPLALGGALPPWAAGLGMATSSLVVVLNSLRLAR
ncbi:MAG: heavy metal translocating P-type ATPase [Vitreoscilla sp.]